ncbi:MAG: endonuclease/exonuclease/phosphatase, partial [Bacteroidota bacterium]
MKKEHFLFLVLVIALTCSSFSQQFGVMTYNIKYDDPYDEINSWDSRKEWIVSQIGSRQPGVFGIQEGLKHQLDFLSSQLESYNYIGVGRDDGQEKGEYSAIFFDTTKVK